jgi:glycyl-tRNA synthetase
MPMPKKTNPQPLTFQEIILRLQEFWAREGCLIWQPYNEKVGAGTGNPATFLRVLGPEQWNVAYVEPSCRPADGRYGENPNRLQQYYQFQVILKPDPGDPQGLYLRSLEALGVNLGENDVRFVEDNWESPALGAWGLGWEVWLNGQEITQFTYFQQAGGIELPVPAVEITYGIERIVMGLQKVSHFKDIRWVDQVRYGDVYMQNEREQSAYNFKVANVDRLKAMYDAFEAEAKSAMAAGVVMPAYDAILRCSHTFNVLDARGAIGVTERAGYFGRMRDLARGVAEAFLKSREADGYPLLGKFKAPVAPSVPTEKAKAKKRLKPEWLVFEIGVEEFPAAESASARAQLAEKLPAALKQARLVFKDVQVFGTPRRISAIVRGLAPTQLDLEEVIKGPPISIARAADGSPSPALLGFAKKNGVDPKALKEEGGYFVLHQKQKGKPTAAILPETLSNVVSSIAFPKVMRWNASGAAYCRPLRWMVALYGEEVIPVEWHSVRAGRATRGLRPLGSPVLVIRRAADYLKTIRAAGIEPDPRKRADKIRKQADRLAKQAGGLALYQPGLLEEVTDLVENPVAVLGSFDPAMLALPREVLVSVMRKHQRYFPVVAGAALLPNFIAVRNSPGTGGADQVRAGNEQVLRARFADASFFVQEDRKKKLEDFLPRLATLTFQTKLGSMLDKTRRVESLTAALAPQLGATPAEAALAVRAAHLAKADLATQMVVEMTSLQGVMGKYYAMDSGEAPEVATAIEEHYKPRGAEDSLPVSKPGVVVAVVDRLDSLAGLFAAGLAPTGARDPFALRRAAIGIIQILIERNLSFHLGDAIQKASAGQPLPVSDAVQAQLREFIAGRLRGVLTERGFRYDVVEAVLGAHAMNPAAAHQAARELTHWSARPEWTAVLAAYARCVRITRDYAAPFTVDADQLREPAERTLWGKITAMEVAVRDLRDRSASTVDSLLAVFAPNVSDIAAFFDGVLVMAEEEGVRQNRLGMLQRIAHLPDGLVDLSKMEGF